MAKEQKRIFHSFIIYVLKEITSVLIKAFIISPLLNNMLSRCEKLLRSNALNFPFFCNCDSWSLYFHLASLYNSKFSCVGCSVCAIARISWGMFRSCNLYREKGKNQDADEDEDSNNHLIFFHDFISYKKKTLKQAQIIG